MKEGRLVQQWPEERGEGRQAGEWVSEAVARGGRKRGGKWLPLQKQLPKQKKKISEGMSEWCAANNNKNKNN